MPAYNRVAPAVTQDAPHKARQLTVDDSGNTVVADASGGVTVFGGLALNSVPPIVRADSSSNLFWLPYI